MIGVVVTCEHASWTLPPGVELGVSDAALRGQASWDLGALAVATDVAAALAAPLHAGRYSRMWVDLNRPPEHADVIPAVSYGEPVPGNVGLTDGDRAARLARDHAPYWDAVERDVTAALDRDGACLQFSSHSFDPSLDPERRRFDLGVLYDPDHRFEAELAEVLLTGLAAAGFAVRANQPYGGTGPALCTSLRERLRHRRFAGIELETSYAVAHQPGGTARIAAAVAPLLAALCGRR